ncbi:MAG: DUF4190 domain-containing protein [Planctomycetota bacterium]|jgi:heme/copper-type cytochrome/quinol oxidase subunit 4
MSQAPPGAPTEGGQFLQPHRGVLILVFGILSIVICFIFGIVAWVMANGDLRMMQAGQMDPSGEGMVRAGKICGIIGVALAALGVCVSLFWFLVMGAAIAGGAAGGPTP